MVRVSVYGGEKLLVSLCPGRFDEERTALAHFNIQRFPDEEFTLSIQEDSKNVVYFVDGCDAIDIVVSLICKGLGHLVFDLPLHDCNRAEKFLSTGDWWDMENFLNSRQIPVSDLTEETLEFLSRYAYSLCYGHDMEFFDKFNELDRLYGEKPPDSAESRTKNLFGRVLTELSFLYGVSDFL